MTGRRYLVITLALCAAVLVPALALNLVLGNRSQGDPATTRLASEWQQATRGVTYPAPIMYNRPFKALRLLDRLPEINAVVFGASSAFGIRADMFPADVRVYNYSQSGNPLHVSLGEAAYLLRQHPGRFEWFFLPLDWSIGFLFSTEPAMDEVDLAPEAVLRGLQARAAPLHERLADALSYPKLEILGEVLRDVARAPRPWYAFRQAFFETSGDEYACPDGARAKDFDVLYRGKCGGFHYDGGNTFGAWKRIRAQDVQQKVLAASLPSSKYSQALAATGGRPSDAYLKRAAELNRELKRQGGRLVAFLPPLIPGLEARLADAPHSAAALARLKTALAEWAKAEGIVILDAGRSERFGCQPLEFLDEHHALDGCNRRVFERFWLDHRQGLPAGLYPVQ